MPLLATLDGQVRIDATDVADDVWAGIHRARPRRRLTCRECSHPLHAKEMSKSNLRFFAHDADAPTCSTAEESADHLRWKREVAEAIRQVSGWSAHLEEPIGRRRADVVATDDSCRIAFEVQLSEQTPADYVTRTNDYTNEGVATVWLVRPPRRPKSAAGLKVPRLTLIGEGRVSRHQATASRECGPSWLKYGVPVPKLTWAHKDRQVELRAAVRDVLLGVQVWDTDRNAWSMPDGLALDEVQQATVAARTFNQRWGRVPPAQRPASVTPPTCGCPHHAGTALRKRSPV